MNLELQRLIEQAAESRCEFLKARECDVARKEEELNRWMNLRHVLEAHYTTDWPNGDILIRVKRNSVVTQERADWIDPASCEVKG